MSASETNGRERLREERLREERERLERELDRLERLLLIAENGTYIVPETAARLQVRANG